MWRCPLEWCAVWKGSISDCLGHLHEKHGGSQYVALKNIAKFFPPWTVTQDVRQTALRLDVSGIAVDAQLFHDAGCRLVHKYRVYKDPFPHPALRGGVLPRLLSFVGRAMAIAQLTELRISIPALGASPGQVPEECFLGGTSSRGLTSPHRVSFASDVTVLGGAPPQDSSPNIVLHDPPCPEMDMVGATTEISGAIVPPLPGFRQFSWPREKWSVSGEPSLFDFATGLPGWFPWSYGE